MSIKNKYVKRSKISEAKFRKLIQYFAMDLDAKAIAAFTGLNRNTVNRYLTLIRERIAEFNQQTSPLKRDVDNVKFQPFKKGMNGEKDTATVTDAPIFGIFQCKQKIYTVILPGNDFPVTDQCESYKLPRNSRFQNKREYRCANEKFIHNFKSFLSYTRKRLMKFHGIPESTFYLHLKECEFRFNHRNEDIYPILLNIIRNNPLC